MLTGFNTDVRHQDVVFHVQTEDKGRSNPVVESLVYLGGRVLAARKVEYADLIAAGKGERDILALMDRQHRLMIVAVQTGKLDHKLRPSANESNPNLAAELELDTSPPDAPDTVIEEVARAENERTLDQVILEYLAMESGQEQLLLTLEQSSAVRAGARALLNLRALSSRDGRGIGRATVMVKLISTTARPTVLATGETGQDGRVDLLLDIPAVDGVAALLISATSEIGRAEIKQLL
jgi:hypothetical protein